MYQQNSYLTVIGVHLTMHLMHPNCYQITIICKHTTCSSHTHTVILILRWGGGGGGRGEPECGIPVASSPDNSKVVSCENSAYNGWPPSVSILKC